MLSREGINNLTSFLPRRKNFNSTNGSLVTILTAGEGKEDCRVKLDLSPHSRRDGGFMACAVRVNPKNFCVMRKAWMVAASGQNAIQR